jgi:branched-chain amino acid aminotransferase
MRADNKGEGGILALLSLAFPEAKTMKRGALVAIGVFGASLLYGDGIFEGIRFYHGRVFRLEEHLARLWDSAHSICLEIPMSMRDMTEAVLETIRQNHLRDGYIRLLVTRGVGNLGLNPTQCKYPSVIIIAATIALYHENFYRKGLTIVTCATRRSNPAALNPAVKSRNYLNNVMARIEANLAGADEALMLNDAGNVAECTADNVFIIKRGQIFTPPITAGALRGITRSIVFEIAAELASIMEADITRMIFSSGRMLSRDGCGNHSGYPS